MIIAEIQRSTRNGRGETTPVHYRIQYWEQVQEGPGDSPLFTEVWPHHSTHWLPTTFERFVTRELFEDDQPADHTVLIRTSTRERRLTADQVLELGEARFILE